jgi:hypothetical protein
VPEALGLHPTRGSVRHGEVPTPSRQYYSVRSSILRQRAWSRAGLKSAAIALAGLPFDIRRPEAARRVAARLLGVWDGLRRRGGRANYWFVVS